MAPRSKSPIVNSLRTSRSWHKYFSVALALLLLVSAVTGVLLGWKKNAEWLQPVTVRGSEGEFSDWMSMSSLAEAATSAFAKTAGHTADARIDRIDARPSKNVVKVRFEYEDYEVQVDAISGRVLNVGKRNADWIERIHDGSIISQPFKLVSMNVLGLGLLVLVVTGTWLYYGPKRFRALRQRRS